MKKIILALFAAALVTPLCFAAQSASSAQSSAPQPAEVKVFTGKVESLVIGDKAKGIKSVIAVINDKGEKLQFRVRPGTAIAAKDGKAVMLNSVKNGSMVTVNYVTVKSGALKANSIKLLE